MMNNTIINISPAEARRIALKEAGTKKGEFVYQTLLNDRGNATYQLDFVTDFMCYTCYVNAECGEVVGFDYMPTVA